MAERRIRRRGFLAAMVICLAIGALAFPGVILREDLTGRVVFGVVWHRHEHEDELFLVISGHLRIDLAERSSEFSDGEFLVVPRGADHRPVALGEATSRSSSGHSRTC